MTHALNTLLEHAERLRDEARAALLQAEDKARRLQLQAAQLHDYRAEYRQRHPALGGRSSSPELLRVHQDFMLRLDQALAQQQAQCEAAGQRTVALCEALLAQELRVAAVRKLVERRAQQARSQDDRREQQRSDEAAQRRRPDPHATPQCRLGSDLMPLTH